MDALYGYFFGRHVQTSLYMGFRIPLLELRTPEKDTSHSKLRQFGSISWRVLLIRMGTGY